MSIKLSWDDMVKARQRIKENGLKVTPLKLDPDDEYKDPFDLLEEKIKKIMNGI